MMPLNTRHAPENIGATELIFLTVEFLDGHNSRCL